MLHYHRRNNISLLCSEWEQVVLLHYDCQEKLVKIKKSALLSKVLNFFFEFFEIILKKFARINQAFAKSIRDVWLSLTVY